MPRKSVAAPPNDTIIPSKLKIISRFNLIFGVTTSARNDAFCRNGKSPTILKLVLTIKQRNKLIVDRL